MAAKRQTNRAEKTKPVGEAFQLSAGLLRACGMPPPKKPKGAAKLDPYRDRFLASRRDLTPDEVVFAEDDQVLDAVALYGPATLSYLADGLDGEHSDARDGSGEFFVLDWGGFPETRASRDARRDRVRRVLARLREQGLVRLVGRLWMPTRAGAERAGWNMAKWPAFAHNWRRDRAAEQKLRRNARRREARRSSP
jgi:hypothetical protein